MPRLTPIHYKTFENFLRSIGCEFVRSEGDHFVWRKTGLARPIVVRHLKDIPVFEIKSNLKTLGITVAEYQEMLNRI